MATRFLLIQILKFIPCGRVHACVENSSTVLEIHFVSAHFLQNILYLKCIAFTVIKVSYTTLSVSKCLVLIQGNERYTWAYVPHCRVITPFAPFIGNSSLRDYKLGFF